MAKKKTSRKQASFSVRIDGKIAPQSADPRLPPRPRGDRVRAAVQQLIEAIETYGRREGTGDFVIPDRVSAVQVSEAWDQAEALVYGLWRHLYEKHKGDVGLDPVETGDDRPLVPAITAARDRMQLPEGRVGPAGRYRARDRVPAQEVEEYRRVLRILDRVAGGTESAAPKKRRGRPRQTDLRQDRQIAEAWMSKSYANLTDLSRELGISKEEVRRALDRHRKRSSN